MNKLLGFYELNELSLPTIPWKEFKEDTKLNGDILWTVRTAVHHGEDLNLPRCVGVEAHKAEVFANSLLQRYGQNGMIIYYPFFLAEKSGTINVFADRIIIEAVKEDLWNLVTLSDREVTIIVKGDEVDYIGDKGFISKTEFIELLSHVKEIKRMFRDDLMEGSGILLEWSYAYKSDINKNKRGERYLVFYEVRTV